MQTELSDFITENMVYSNKKRNLSRTSSTDSTELVFVPSKETMVLLSQSSKGNTQNQEQSRKKDDTTSTKNVPLRRENTFKPCQFVAIDCEMVGIGMDGLDSALARVVVIDYNNEILLDQYVKPDQEVVDYRSYISGITPQHLQDENNVVDFITCQKKVLDIVKDKVIVGHGLKNDLSVLQIQHPWYMIRDTAKYEPFMKERVGYNDGVLWPRKLKDLCTELLQKDIQQIGQSHSPYEDSVAAFDLYKTVATKWESLIKYKQMKTAVIKEHRQQQKQHKVGMYQQQTYYQTPAQAYYQQSVPYQYVSYTSSQ